MKNKNTAIAALLLLVACSASAADDAAQWRIGASMAYSEYERDGVTAIDGGVDDGGQGFEFFAQYRFNSLVGLEGGFYISPDFQGDSDLVAAFGETETSYQGGTLNAIGYLPLPFERADFFLKAGYFNFDADVTTTTATGVTKDTGTDDGLALGAGFSVAATEQIGLRFEFDWYDVSGADLYTFDIGVEYRF